VAAVRVEEQAFSDDRFEDLALLAGLADADHARGKMVRLWRQCTLEQTHYLPAITVTRVLGARGVEALVEARLGEQTDRGIRIRGTKGRIEWLKKVRDNGKFGAKGGRPKRNPPGFTGEPTRVSQPGDRETPITPASASASASAQISDPPSPGGQADPELTLRQGSRAMLWLELQETRQAVAAELGIEARPLAVHDPGERELACRLVEAGPGQLESAVDNARHVIAVAATEARRKRTVQWLTGAMFEARPWRRALGMTIADADRRDPKARPPGAPNAGRVEPHAPRDYGSGDIEL
jgi:hypothetical protein